MKKQSTIKQTRNFDLRPASVEEAGLFYTAENQDTALGTVSFPCGAMNRRRRKPLSPVSPPWDCATEYRKQC